MTDRLDLRAAAAGDDAFLFRLYCDTRTEEVNRWGWPAPQQEAFLRMQFEARRRSYQAAYPAAVNEIICAGAAPIGRILTARDEDSIWLVDIALLGSHRNQGIGAGLIERLLAECARESLKLRLQVAVGNPAERLYRRLGLREIARDEIYVAMESAPGDI